MDKTNFDFYKFHKDVNTFPAFYQLVIKKSIILSFKYKIIKLIIEVSLVYFYSQVS